MQQTNSKRKYMFRVRQMFRVRHKVSRINNPCHHRADVPTRKDEIIEGDEVAELDCDPLGAQQAWLVQRHLQLTLELQMPDQR